MQKRHYDAVSLQTEATTHLLVPHRERADLNVVGLMYSRSAGVVHKGVAVSGFGWPA